MVDEPGRVVEERGVQVAALSYPDLPAEEIHAALERMYRAFYMRPRPILRIMRDMLRDPRVLRRRLREGREFLSFMSERRRAPMS